MKNIVFPERVELVKSVELVESISVIGIFMILISQLFNTKLNFFGHRSFSEGERINH